MKLIGPQKNQVQSLGRHQSGLTAEAGKAQAIQTVTQGVSQSLETISSAAENILQVNSSRQEQQSGLLVQKEEHDFWEPWGGRDFIDVSELENSDFAHLVTDGMRLKGRIASAEVIPQMYTEHMNKALKNASKIIENDNVRSDWMVGANDTLLGRRQSVQTSANAQIDRQIFIDQKMNYDNLMDIDRPDLALIATEGMKGNPKIVEGLADEAHKGVETVRYEKFMLDNDLEGVIRSIEHLSQKPEDYQEQNGKLDAGERLAWRNELQRYWNSKVAGSDAAIKAEKRALQREIRMTEENTNGASSSADVDIALYERVKAWNKNHENELNVEELDLIAKIGFHGVNDTMLLKDRADRRKFIKDKKLKVQGFEADHLNEKLRASNESMTSLENTNFMKAAEKAGFFGGDGLVDVDFSAAPADLAESLGDRYNQFIRAQSNYGENLGEGIFNKDNIPTHAAIINGRSAMDKVQIFAAVNDRFGPNSMDVYRQLGTDGSAETFAVAGSIALEAPSMSEMIIIGEEYAKSPERDLSDVIAELKPKIEKEMAGVYGADFEWGSANQKAALYGYIGMAKDTTDLTTVDSAKGRLWFDKGIFEQTIDGITGGVIERDDVKFVAPRRGMTTDDFDDWANGLNPTELAKKYPNINQRTAERITSKIFSGDLKFIPRTRGEYLLQQSDGTFVSDNTGGTFKIEYDPDLKKPWKQ